MSPDGEIDRVREEVEVTAPPYPFIPPGSSTCAPPEAAFLRLMELRLALPCIINQARVCSALLLMSLLSLTFNLSYMCPQLFLLTY